MKVLLNILILCIATTSVAQLEQIQNSYLMNGLVVNPAFAGSQEVLTLNLGIRRQWLGLNGSPKSQYFSAHSLTKNHKHAGSIKLVNNSITIHSSNTLKLGYAYQLKLTEGNHLNLGFDAGFTSQTSDWNSIILNEQVDINFNNIARQKMIPQFRFGAFFYNDKLFAGFSTENIFNSLKYSSETSSFRDGLSLNLNAGYKFKFENNLELTPSILFKTQLFTTNQLDVNVMAKYKLLSAGINYRTKDATSLLVGVNLWGNTDIVYAFGYNFNALSTISNGNHELILRYIFLYQLEDKDPRFL